MKFCKTIAAAIVLSASVNIAQADVTADLASGMTYEQVISAAMATPDTSIEDVLAQLIAAAPDSVVEIVAVAISLFPADAATIVATATTLAPAAAGGISDAALQAQNDVTNDTTPPSPPVTTPPGSGDKPAATSPN